MTSKLRFGHLNYINALPLYTGLVQGKVPFNAELVSGFPAQLNQMLGSDEIDVSLVSSYAYLTNQDKYDLLPGFCIGAEDRVMTVNLYTKVGIEGLDRAKIALTPQSASSVQLLKILCHNFWNVSPEFVPLPALESATDHDAFLLIGDQALQHRHFEGYQTIDLATAWNEKTALPMTFAVFAVRKQVMQNRSQEVELLASQLEQSLQWGETNRDTIDRLGAQQASLPEPILHDYYNILRYRLSRPQWDGLRTFASLSDLPVPEPLTPVEV